MKHIIATLGFIYVLFILINNTFYGTIEFSDGSDDFSTQNISSSIDEFEERYNGIDLTKKRTALIFNELISYLDKTIILDTTITSINENGKNFIIRGRLNNKGNNKINFEFLCSENLYNTAKLKNGSKVLIAAHFNSINKKPVSHLAEDHEGNLINFYYGEETIITGSCLDLNNYKI